MLVRDDVTQAQVDRVLQSATFRNAEVLRRLLRFLADKSISGEADQLKEYSVGIDALGKPATYDPRQDSVVRIQIGRLRHKLADYYQTEGKDDPLILELPKGHFKLTWRPRPEAPPAEAAPVETVIVAPAPRRNWLPVACAVLSVWAVLASAAWWREQRISAPFRQAWTPELRELWKPFLTSERPLILAISSPMFIGLQGNGLYRDLSINRWEDAALSPKVAALRKALGDPGMLPRYYYTGFGEVNAALQLGKLLNWDGVQMSTARSSQVSWQQLADNNVLFVGPPRVFGDQLRKLPAELDFVLEEDGVHDRHPQPDHAPVLRDNFPSIAGQEANGAPDDGEIYALVTHTPGPLGNGDLQSFHSNHSPGSLAAVQWFTNPEFAKELLGHLRRADGTIPRYFQLVLKVKYRDGVPTETTYVTHRELRLTAPR